MASRRGSFKVDSVQNGFISHVSTDRQAERAVVDEYPEALIKRFTEWVKAMNYEGD